MTHPLLLTVDLGTTNCKAAAFELDGSPAASAAVPYATASPRDGWHEQRPADWLAALSTSVRAVTGELGPRVGAVAGIAVSAWGPGLVLVDRSGRALNEWSPTWQDVRSLAHGRALVDRVGAGWIGGGMPLTGFPAKLAWATEAWPELARDAAYALGVKDFLLHRLTGRFVTDPSSGPYGAGWAEPAFEAVGLGPRPPA